jgi:AcrR family transcriptional regulator
MWSLDWADIHVFILQLERDGKVTRTFRRLDPERQQAVVTAIFDEAIERGPTALNIKQVAERAGVAVGSLYTYFGSRDGLMDFAVALCVRFTGDLFDSARPLLAALPFREGLKMFLAGGVEWGETQAGLLRFFTRAAYHADSDLSEQVVRPIATILRGIVHDMLTQAIARGEVRADIDLEATTRLIHALTIAFGDSQMLPYLNVYWQITGDDVTPERAMDTLIELVMDGIGVCPPDVL